MKIKFGGKVKLNLTVDLSKSSEFEGMNKIHANTHFTGIMGYGSYIGNDCFINGKIGRFTSIAPMVRCNLGIHPYAHFVSTSPAFYSKSKFKNGNTFSKTNRINEFRFADEKNKLGIIIGNDCWIGEGAFFVGGLTVGDGAVVLAHAVVNKDIPPYAIVGGVPAKIIKYRFEEDTISFLLNFKWWNKDILWLKKNVDIMGDIERLKNRYEKL